MSSSVLPLGSMQGLLNVCQTIGRNIIQLMGEQPVRGLWGITILKLRTQNPRRIVQISRSMKTERQDVGIDIPEKNYQAEHLLLKFDEWRGQMWQFLEDLPIEFLVSFWWSRKTWILISIIYESAVNIYTKGYFIRSMYYTDSVAWDEMSLKNVG